MSVDVGKVIGKTALKTTIIVLVVLILACAAFAGFFPGKLSDLGDDIGSSYLAVVFSERQYQRSGDINDLGTLVERSIKYGKDETTVTYAKELLNFKADGTAIFEDYAAFKDEQMQEFLGREYSYDDYINGNLAAALWTNKAEEGILYAVCGKLYVTQNRYGSNNSMTYAVEAYLEYQTKSGFLLLTENLEGSSGGRNKRAEMESHYLACREAAAADKEDESAAKALASAEAELKSLYSDLYRIYMSRWGDAEIAAQYQALYDNLGKEDEPA